MSDHDSSGHEAHSVRGYMVVYFALLAGTALTVWASFIPFGSRGVNIAVALVSSNNAHPVAKDICNQVLAT